MPQIVRLNDTSSHGGTMVSASGDTVAINNRPVCLDGDLHSCPIPGHGVKPVTANSTMYINNKKVIVTGNVAGCGAVIITGSPDVNSE